MNKKNLKPLISKPVQALEKFWLEKGANDALLKILPILHQKLNQGSLCIDLSESVFFMSIEGDITHHSFDQEWIEELKKNKAVGNERDFKPFILSDQNKLYFQKYWAYEEELIQKHLNPRMTTPSLEESIEIYSSKQDTTTEEQFLGVYAGLKNPLSFITGGPGTGKTTIVARILVSYLLSAGREAKRIALAAPTGKAAARMLESLQKEISTLRDQDRSNPIWKKVQNSICEDSFTLHRLLHFQPKKNLYLKNCENPLDYDLIIIDEATMIDLPMMVHLFRALPLDSKVVLLGDQNQLTSVGVGSIFSDLIQKLKKGSYPQIAQKNYEKGIQKKFPKSNQGVGEESELKTKITELVKSFRFKENSGIFAICNAVQSGDYKQVDSLLSPSDPYSDFQYYNNPKKFKHLEQVCLDSVIEECFLPLKNFNAYEEKNILAALNQIKECCLLSPTKKGLLGTERLNKMIVEKMGFQAMTANKKIEAFHGLPIMIQSNDYQNNLFNGDVGIVLKDPHAPSSKKLRAYFPKSQCDYQSFPVNHLPLFEPAYAMTIHKSQGSEYNHVVVLLPDNVSHLCKEILYTGLSRGKKRVFLVSSPKTLKSTVENTSLRASGI